jgi:hypothetical protein
MKRTIFSSLFFVIGTLASAVLLVLLSVQTTIRAESVHWRTLFHSYFFFKISYFSLSNKFNSKLDKNGKKNTEWRDLVCRTGPGGVGPDHVTPGQPARCSVGLRETEFDMERRSPVAGAPPPGLGCFDVKILNKKCLNF